MKIDTVLLEIYKDYYFMAMRREIAGEGACPCPEDIEPSAPAVGEGDLRSQGTAAKDWFEDMEAMGDCC